MEFAVSGSNAAAARDRAERTATVLNELLKDNVQLHEIRLQPVAGTTTEMRLTARGIEVARIIPADALLQNLSTAQTGQKWRDNLRQIFWRETLHGTM